MSYPQYGIYLIPPPYLLQPLGLAHLLLTSEYNTRAASRFMVHCTVKGFFKLAEGATPADFTPALDELFAQTSAFPTEISEVRILNFGPRRVSVLLEMARSEAFSQFQEAVWEIVRPYIASDCLFTPRDPFGPNFLPHLTLVQYDGPSDPGLLKQLANFSQYLLDTSLRGQWLAQDMQLIEFYSEDWAGEWWNTLSYQQLKGWQLPLPTE